ncbi:gamma-glutamylcyclotransferase family protein [Rubinisphaera italica]|nr:gamma-glutamylcyclotransferase family protein [Rubinisphaera italica]
MMTSESPLLFVYGTLKRGYCRDHYLQKAKFIGEAKTEASYLLYDCGEYPGLVHDPNGHNIEGELYEISENAWLTLDEVEGVSFNLYQRATVELLAPYHEMNVQSYLYLRSTNGLKKCGQRW